MCSVRWPAVVVVTLVVGGVGSATDLQQRARETFEPVPASAPAIAGNPATPEKVALGAMLFFEPRLSRSGLISCNSCHSVGTAGADNVPTSIGHGWQRGPRNAPSVLNAVLNGSQFWDGRAADLKAQAKGPVQAAVEMGNTPEQVVSTLASIGEYVDRFRRAFPGDPSPVSFDNMAAAIEVFEATLITPGAPFDRYLAGDQAALEEEQKTGLDLFMRQGCAMCHRGANLGGNGYFRFGVQQSPGPDILPAGDRGRLAVTQAASDEYVFRAAPLRNVALTAPYFHSGSVWDLEGAVTVMGSSQLGQTLGAGDVRAIAAFLRTLTGEQPKVVYPTLPPSTPGTPKPRT